MKGKVFTVLCLMFYLGLVYTAYNPNHSFLGVLDGLRTVYLIIHVPLTILIVFLAVALAVFSKNIKSQLSDMVDSLIENEEDDKIKNLVNNMEKYFDEVKKMRATLILNRLIWYPTTIITIMVLGDHFLGSVMFFSAISSLYLNIFVNSFGKKMLKELKNAI